jgi:hypothetical protein
MFNEKAPLCSCRKDKIAYICRNAQCPNHHTQRLYCQNCLNIGNHLHFPLHQIYTMLSETDIKWSQLMSNLKISIITAKSPSTRLSLWFNILIKRWIMSQLPKYKVQESLFLQILINVRSSHSSHRRLKSSSSNWWPRAMSRKFLIWTPHMKNWTWWLMTVVTSRISPLMFSVNNTRQPC